MDSSGLPAAPHPTERLLGTAPAIAALRAQIRHLVTFDTIGSTLVPTLLLQGETGTGKGLVARVIHDSGPRARGPFVDVNCAAIPETMLEAELFGFEAGAFTDARRAKPGLFEAGSGGTLFLDEIDALPLALQGKLLTAIEAKQVRRLGAVGARAVDVKLIAATNVALPEAVTTGRFRADLYHRLAVVVMTLPPLRERGQDVAGLAQAFLRQYTAAHGVSPKRLSAAAAAWLQGYLWPGNVRELIHVMERVTLLHVGEEVEAETLTQLCLPLTPLAVGIAPAPGDQEGTTSTALPAEANEIRQALAQTGGNVARAARLLGISRDTIRYRMQRYGIIRPRLETPSPPGATMLSYSVPLTPPEADLPELQPLDAAQEERLPAALTEVITPTGSRQERAYTSSEAAGERDTPLAVPAWEQKPVVVLALEMTWPERSGLEPLSYDPWTTLARWEQAILDKVQGFGGVLLHRTTALLTWVFGLPQALEQLPQRAVHSALAIRQMVAVQAPELGPGPTVRFAVHLGAVQVEQPSQVSPARVLAVGDSLALPVRLLGQAGPGELVVSPEVGRLVESLVVLEAREWRLRAGDPARVRGYAVVGRRPGYVPRPPSGGQPRSPFVGRTRELTLLEAVWEQVQAGQGQVIGLVGAPGIGKSRFLLELRHRCSAQGIPYCEGQCLAYSSATPYLPILDLLRGHCGLTESDQPEALTAKVRQALADSGSDPEAGLPLLADLLGLPVAADWVADLSAEVRRARTFATLAQMFLASCQRQPLVLAVENLHWIDPTSEAFLTLLIEQVAGVPLLVLTTARPGYRAPWVDRSYVTQFALPPLDPEASRQVVRHVLAHQALAPALEQQLLAKAEGNPFFLEELAHTVQEQEGPRAVLAVPDTIQAVLAARLDRLPALEKRLVQAAAVIGREVAIPLLQAMLGLPEATLHRSLERLQAAEFLFPKRFGLAPTYVFKHVLVQEAAYQSLPMPTRRQDHQKVARVLVEHLPALVATQPELLAHHATEAGLGAQAVAYWQRAGQRALERSAHVEATRHLTRGLELLQTLPDTPERLQQELDLQTGRGLALMATRGYAALEVGQAYARARELCRQIGATPQLFPVLWGLWAFYAVRAEHQTACELGEQLLTLARSVQDPLLLVVAHYTLGFTWFCLGEMTQARTHLEESAALYDPQQHRSYAFLYGGQDPGVACRSYMSWALWLLGYPDQALQSMHDALALAHELSHPFSLVYALAYAARVRQLRREWQEAQAQAEAAIALATAQRFAQWLAQAMILQGWALAEQGQREDGIAQMRQALDAYWTTGAKVLWPYFLAMLAGTYGTGGQAEEGLTALAEALAAVDNTGEGVWQAELYRLKGELLLRQSISNQHEAETCFHQALDIARHQQAKALELRTSMSLGRLWQQQDKRAEARQLLGEVYGWFTEGFDTADLQEARTLLAELG